MNMGFTFHNFQVVPTCLGVHNLLFFAQRALSNSSEENMAYVVGDRLTYFL